MDLQYTGPSFDESGGIVPLPEGWPAFDHDEPDAALARAKVASGKYRAKRPEAPAADAETRGRASRAAAAKED